MLGNDCLWVLINPLVKYLVMRTNKFNKKRCVKLGYDSNDDSDEEFYQLVAVTCEAVVTYFNKYINKTPCYDSE